MCCKGESDRVADEQGGGLRTSLRFCFCVPTIAILIIISVILAIALVSCPSSSVPALTPSMYVHLVSLSTISSCPTTRYPSQPTDSVLASV